MITKKIPMRSCVVTKERCPKQDLIRVVRTTDGNVVIDASGKVNGHGAYLKKDLKVFEQAKKSKVLNRYLETEISDDLFEQLKALLNK